MSSKIKDLLGMISAVFLIVAIIFLGVQIYNLTRGGYDLSNTRSINMSAEGTVTARPDIATLSFSVVTQGRDAAQVQTSNDAKMETVIGFLKEQGIKEDDIKTSGYNLYPQYDYSRPNATQEIIGYNLNQNVTAKIRDLNAVGGILGGLTSRGVNQINNVAYSIDDPDSLKADARNQAIDNARTKAKELADRLGVKLGKVINFAESSNGYIPYPVAYAEDRAIGFGGGSAPVEPGTQDITISVTLTFELR